MGNSRSFRKASQRKSFAPKYDERKKRDLTISETSEDLAERIAKEEYTNARDSRIFYFFIVILGFILVLLNIQDTNLHFTLGVFTYDGTCVGLLVMALGIWLAYRTYRPKVTISHTRDR